MRVFDSAEDWQVFGYDVRRLGGLWRYAWKDLLWADNSPVRQLLDEHVALHTPEGISYYHAGRPVAGGEHCCDAVLLSDEVVLARTLTLPLAAEAELAAVLALQVKSLSPFDAGDTAYGWAVTERGEDTIRVDLAIVSRAGVMTYIGEEYDRHDKDAQEIWAPVADSLVVVRGFGERQRDRRYLKRLLRSCGMLLACLLVSVLMLAASTAMKRNELNNLRDLAERTSTQSSAASELRSNISAQNDTLTEVNAVIERFPNPHLELVRLTRLLGDDAFVERFSMSGPGFSIRGRARDASIVMQQLAQEPHYGHVKSNRAISRRGDTEEFFLEVSFAKGASGELD